MCCLCLNNRLWQRVKASLDRGTQADELEGSDWVRARCLHHGLRPLKRVVMMERQANDKFGSFTGLRVDGEVAAMFLDHNLTGDRQP